MRPRVLFVEDEPSISGPFSSALSREGFDAVVCGTLAEARAAFGGDPFYLVLLDLMLPDGDGRDFARDVRASGSEVPIIIDAVDWCRDQLSSEDLDFLRTLEPKREIPLEGGATLLLFHGSPRSHMDDLLATTPAEEVDRLLGEHRATVMVWGTTVTTSRFANARSNVHGPSQSGVSLTYR